MASSIPSQTRAIDPFAAYNSNVVNRVTRIYSQGIPGLLAADSMEVTQDGTATVTVEAGYALIDDVLIQIESSHTVDFDDANHYYSGSIFPQETGNHYVVLTYTYAKSKPAPQANIKILKPSQRNLISTTTNMLLLGVVNIQSLLGSYVVNAVYDYDPQVGYTDNARQYIKYYSGLTAVLESHRGRADQGRFVYETTTDKWYLGLASSWQEVSFEGFNTTLATDGTNVTIGNLCYIDSNKRAQLALSTNLNTAADLVVTRTGDATTGSGSLGGNVNDVPVESGITISVGDLLYLSSSDPGTVTNIKTSGVYQVVGRALTGGNLTISMVFTPRALVVTSKLTGVINPGDWTLDGSGSYYEDIDVLSLNGTDAFDTHWFDDSDNKELIPEDVQILFGGTTIRVWMPINTITINYVIR